MVGRKPVFADRLTVIGGGIPLVLLPIIDRVLLGDLRHVGVAVRFCQDRGGRNVGKTTIALHKAGVGDRELRAKAVAVDGQKLWRRIEARGRQRHALERGIEDIDLVDALGRDRLDGPGHRLALDNGAQHFAVALGHLLRVVEERVVKIGRQNHRSGKDRPGQAATPRLIAPRLQKIVL